MNTRLVLMVLVILIIAGVGAYAFANRANAPTAPEAPVSETNDASKPPTAGSPAASATAHNTATVVYTKDGFTPSSLTIRVGDTVTFKNESMNDMWVGVDEHPTHTEYDGTSKDQHCVGGAPTGGVFDQCSRGGPDTSWTYTFTKTGTFDYHNHVQESHTGTIVVGS